MRIIPVALFAILAAASAAAAQAPAPLVRNGDFEAGFEDGVAIGWTAWGDPWGAREYDAETTDPHGGGHAQGWSTVKGSCSGIYQIVRDLTPGQAYRVTMWTRYQSQGDMWTECGFDPAGGSDRDDVHWTKMEGEGKAGRWLKYQGDLVAQGSAASLWFKWGTTSQAGSSGAADDVSLEPIEAAQVNWCSAAGRVLVANGPPLPGATITARPGPATVTSAAGGGHFSFDRLYPDTYSFTADKPGYLPDSVSEVVIAGGEAAPVSLTLTPLEYVTGGDFEGAFTEGIASCWTPWRDKNAEFTASRSTAVKHGGDACQQWVPVAGQSGLRQIVVGLREGATYDLSVWMRADANAQVACGYDPAGGKALADATWLPAPAPGPQGWRHYAAAVKPHNDRLTIWLAWGGGRGWVDDISLVVHDSGLDASSSEVR